MGTCCCNQEATNSAYHSEEPKPDLDLNNARYSMSNSMPDNVGAAFDSPSSKPQPSTKKESEPVEINAYQLAASYQQLVFGYCSNIASNVIKW